MLEFLIDLCCALLLAVVLALLGPRLMPRLKRLHGGILFGAVLVVTAVAGLLLTPLRSPMIDAAVLAAAAFVTLGAIVLVAAGRGDVPSVVDPPDDENTEAERNVAAAGMVSAYIWFVLLFVLLVAIRWTVY